MSERPRCDGCGRFLPLWARPGSSWLFVPDTPFTREEHVQWCPECTEKNGGPPISRQSTVDSEACSGVAQEKITAESISHGGLR